MTASRTWTIYVCPCGAFSFAPECDNPIPGHPRELYSEHAVKVVEVDAVYRQVVAERDRLKEALEPFAAIFERYEQVHDLDANEVVVPYVALFNAHKQLEAARAALSVSTEKEN